MKISDMLYQPITYGEIECAGGDFFWDEVRLPTGYEADEDEEECEEEGFFF